MVVSKERSRNPPSLTIQYTTFYLPTVTEVSMLILVFAFVFVVTFCSLVSEELFERYL